MTVGWRLVLKRGGWKGVRVAKVILYDRMHMWSVSSVNARISERQKQALLEAIE